MSTHFQKSLTLETHGQRAKTDGLLSLEVLFIVMRQIDRAKA